MKKIKVDGVILPFVGNTEGVLFKAILEEGFLGDGRQLFLYEDPILLKNDEPVYYLATKDEILLTYCDLDDAKEMYYGMCGDFFHKLDKEYARLEAELEADLER